MIVINEKEYLDTFRRKYSAAWGFEALRRSNGMVLINLAIGVGKSYLMDDMIKTAIFDKYCDLVIVLLPTRKLIDERPWIQYPPNNVNIVNLMPRPVEKCGKENNRQWSHFETNGMGLLGRESICKNCLKSKNCFWPDQYEKNKLQDCQVVFATQTHLINRPDFIKFIQSKTDAKKVLTLIDEGNFIVSPFRRTLNKDKLEMFLENLIKIQQVKKLDVLEKWITYVRVLLDTTTTDIRRPVEWCITPIKDKKLVSKIQAMGVNMFGSKFRYMEYDIVSFGNSLLASRQKTGNGNIIFATPPSFGQEFVFFSGTTSPELASFRIGVDVKPAFQDIVFENPYTRWYNICSKIGMARYFLN